MFCANCGKEVSNTGNFCHHCGSQIKNEASEVLVQKNEIQNFVDINNKKENKVANILIMVLATFVLLGAWSYLVGIFAIFGEATKSFFTLLSFIGVIFLWIKGYKSLFKK